MPGHGEEGTGEVSFNKMLNIYIMYFQGCQYLWFSIDVYDF